MTLKQAFFILRHGSAEGNYKYLEAVKVIEDEYNRQKAEIEFWKQNAFDGCMERSRIEKNARVEAVKEFAERLKSRLIIYTHLNFDGVIDNLVKEFTEGKNDE